MPDDVSRRGLLGGLAAIGGLFAMKIVPAVISDECDPPGAVIEPPKLSPASWDVLPTDRR